MKAPLRVLLVEDSEDDALLVLRELSQGGFEVQSERVQDAAAFQQSLRRQDWDLVIADYALPGFNGLAALALLRRSGLDVPYLIVSGAVGEDVAVQGMKAGAHDFLLKGNLSRLVPAVERELREARERRERRRAEATLLESERRFRDIVATVPGVVYQLRQSPDGGRSFPFVSNAVMDVFGVPAEEAMRRAESLSECILPDAQAEFEASVRSSSERLAPWLAELPIRARSGELRWIRGHAVPQREPDGGVLWQGVLVDITERKQAEQTRAQLEGQLRQAQKMEAIGTLAGGIAHDFNNILAAIIPYTHLAKSDVGDNPEVQESLDQVLQAAERAKNLVQQILAFSRKHKQERRPVRLQEVVREALKLLRSALPSTIQIREELDPDAPAIVADPTQLHQVVMNLCTNAEHAMRGRAGLLGLHLSRFDVNEEFAQAHPDLRAGTYVKLSVSDTGHGMDGETLKRVFDPFFTTKAPGEGTGLGLSVVHGIVKEHEGGIAISSQPGLGTAFDIFLPVQSLESHVPEPPLESIPRGQGEHILFVDDEAPICSVAQRTLERLGYRVTIQTSSLGALADFQSRPQAFDLVVTDLTMPTMTGVDLALRLLDLRPSLPIILATGFGGVWTPDSARRLGIRDVILKPIAPNTLAFALHRALHPARE